MEIVQHIIGACADNHSHLDISDYLLAGGGATASLFTIKYYIKGILLIIKDYITSWR